VVGGGDPPTNTCEIIDLNQPNPSWQSTGAMQYTRRHHNATILPDGTVLVTGGTSGPGFNNNTGYVLPAEIWNPATGTWKKMANMVTPRLYHSTAALLPDGRVLVAGSGRPHATNGGVDQWNVEIYSPPYLFQTARPTITSAPASAMNGSSITIVTPSAASIAKVTLIGLTTTTHAFNMGQHFSQLSFTIGAGEVHANLPSSTTLLPPGYYMLFLLDSSGIPSVSKMIQVLPPGNVGVNDDPSARLLDFLALRSPNPMTHGEARIAFTLTRSEVGTVDVLDVTGRLVKTVADGYFVAGREHIVPWNGTDYMGARVPTGIYLYRLRTPTVTLTGKLALLSR